MRIVRVAFAVAALLVGAALVLHAYVWWRRGQIDWPIAANTSGLFLITLTGFFDPPRGRGRLALTIIALALIVPSTVLLFLRIV